MYAKLTPFLMSAHLMRFTNDAMSKNKYKLMLIFVQSNNPGKAL